VLVARGIEGAEAPRSLRVVSTSRIADAPERRSHPPVDRALRSWILGFGPLVRVVSPPALAEEILEEIEAARELYMPRMAFEMMPVEAPPYFGDRQAALPFRSERRL
jgi:hypothetical protein